MANENLKNALTNAGLSPEEFAEVIQVDPKSVQRWITAATVPYPRHRKAISQALNIAEHELWPGQATAPAPAADTTAAAADTESAGDETEPAPEPSRLSGGDGAGRVGDVIGAWASADQDTAPDLLSLITGTSGPVDILDSCCGIQIAPELTDALIARAAAGHAVRVLTDGRVPHWEPLLGSDQIGLYLCEIPGEYWMIKTSERMLVTINLEPHPDSSPPPPILELAAGGSDGLYHRLATKFEELWEHAHNTDDSGSTHHSSPAQPEAATPEQAAAEPGQDPAASVRRWPRQPN